MKLGIFTVIFWTITGNIGFSDDSAWLNSRRHSVTYTADFSQKPMSALTPKADVCSALVYVG
jgi:hypothetical protein